MENWDLQFENYLFASSEKIFNKIQILQKACCNPFQTQVKAFSSSSYLILLFYNQLKGIY